MDYVTRFTELARFVDDYVATNLAKVRRFENGLKLSIRTMIIGLRLQDMGSMVGTTLTIERELGLEIETLNDRTRPGYPSRVPRVVPPSGVPFYNP